MVQVSRTASLCSRTYQPEHRPGMSNLVTLSCWGAVLSGLGKFHWPDLDLVPGPVGVAYGDRRPQWAWSRSASSGLSGRGLWRPSTSVGVVTSLICISSIPLFTLLRDLQRTRYHISAFCLCATCRENRSRIETVRVRTDRQTDSRIDARRRFHYLSHLIL